MADVENVLHHLAWAVWVKRGEAKRLGLSYSEESITEDLLIKLKLALGSQVTILPFSKKRERKEGADWALAFVSPDGSSFEMLVQAKRLDDRDREYKMLDHAHVDKETGETTRQIDTLRQTAARLDVPALYAFYNHLSDVHRIPPRCFRSIDPDWGISIASADLVNAALPNKLFDLHRHHSIPIRCMACDCRGIKLPLADAAALTVNTFSGGDALAGSDRESRPEPRYWEPRSRMSELFAAVVSIDENYEGEAREQLALSMPEIVGPIDGAIIIRESD